MVSRHLRSTTPPRPRYPRDVPDTHRSRAEITAALRTLDWAPILAKLHAYGMARTKSKAQAQDLAQEAVRRLFDVDDITWNPSLEPDPTRFLISIMTRQISNEKTSGRRHHELSAQNKKQESAILLASERVADGAPSPERAAVARDLAARAMSALEKRIAADASALRVLGLATDGIDTPAEQAEAMGVSKAEILRVRERLYHHAALVARELAGDHTTDDGDDE
jgi:DNA-directed RNA polymerase specialized sigma24 family protein